MVFDDLTADNCYQVMTERDLRFDGHFFVGVRSTRIYCRPMCRVRLPKRGNCSFYRNAASAWWLVRELARGQGKRLALRVR